MAIERSARTAPFIFSNEKATTIVVADGEMLPADADALKQIVAGLP